MIRPGNLFLALGLSLGTLSAQEAAKPPITATAPEDHLTLKVVEFEHHPFDLGGLNLTIPMFLGARGTTYVRLENASKDWLSFSPGDLICVDKDGNQMFFKLRVDVILGHEWFDTYYPSPLKIAPGAHLELHSSFPGMDFPVKVYYNSKLLAEVKQ